MALPKYTLSHIALVGWVLKLDGSDRAIATFAAKEDATKGGVLESHLGKKGGSVKIKLMNGQFEEERTYPASEDPRSSPG